MNLPITDRRAAGRTLAGFLEQYRDRYDVLVLALSPDAVPVGFEISRHLDAMLDLFLVQAITLPASSSAKDPLTTEQTKAIAATPEALDLGALVSSGERILNQDVMLSHSWRQAELKQFIRRQQREISRQERNLRGDRPRPDVNRRCIILVEDVITGGSKVRAAIKVLRAQQASTIIVAVPVAPTRLLNQIQAMCDEVAFIATQEPFLGVKWWYENYHPVPDQEVRDLLTQSYETYRAKEEGFLRSNEQPAAI